MVPKPDTQIQHGTWKWWVSKRNLHFQGLLFSFHVEFRWCEWDLNYQPHLVSRIFFHQQECYENIGIKHVHLFNLRWKVNNWKIMAGCFFFWCQKKMDNKDELRYLTHIPQKSETFFHVFFSRWETLTSKNTPCNCWLCNFKRNLSLPTI